MPVLVVTIYSTYAEVDCAVEKILEFIRTECGVSDNHGVFILNFVLRELLNNAVEHGNGFLEDKKVCCEVVYEKDILKFDISDEGRGFDIDEVIGRDVFENIEGTRGRGIAMIKKIGFDLKIASSHIIADIDLRYLMSGDI